VAIPYGFASWLRAKCYQLGWLPRRRLPVFVVSIGNLTVGGTGKTPVVILLAHWLLAAGKRVAILSRGYRRTGGADPLLVSNGRQILVTAEQAGDEPFLIAARCPGAIVAVGADRYDVGRWVLDQYPVDCVLLDDGFQHLALHRDLNLLLVDATDANGLQAVVPAGRLREPLAAAARASMILVTRADNTDDATHVLRYVERAIGHEVPSACLVFPAQELVAVGTGELRPVEWCRGKTALLCSGIGHAASFRRLADSLGLCVLKEIRFRDHHRFRREDVEAVRTRAAELTVEVVLTTEKDAGKLSPLLDPTDDRWWAVRLDSIVTAGERLLRSLVQAGLKREGRS